MARWTKTASEAERNGPVDTYFLNAGPIWTKNLDSCLDSAPWLLRPLHSLIPAYQLIRLLIISFFRFHVDSSNSCLSASLLLPTCSFALWITCPRTSHPARRGRLGFFQAALSGRTLEACPHHQHPGRTVWRLMNLCPELGKFLPLTSPLTTS